MPTLLGPLETTNLLCHRTQLLKLPLSEGPNRISVSVPSPEEGNFVFSSYLEFRPMDKIHEPKVSESYAPSS
jgi:hypothetical protein